MTGFCNSSGRFLYFQNVYFEIAVASESEGGFRRKAQHKPDLKLLTPLVAWDKDRKGNEKFKEGEDWEKFKGYDDYDILCCDIEDHVRVISRFGRRSKISEPWKIETVDGSPTRLAVDQLGGKLIYQSKVGDIRGVEIGGQDLVGDLLVPSKQVSGGINANEIALLRDEYSPQDSSGESRRDS